MRTRAVVALAVSLLLPLPAAAKEVAGVTFPQTVQAGGKTLQLNGAGLRTRFFLKVYAIGLYLEQPATDAKAILAADQVRRAELRMLRSVSASEMAEAIGDAFKANAGGALPQLQARLDRFKSLFPSANSGEVITLTYVPGTGTVVGAGGKDLGTIEGKDFADVLFSAWIGAHPVDDSLKQALLAGGK
jgi:Chalcone isomerase-like